MLSTIKSSTHNHYIQRIAKALKYLHAHLDSQVDLYRLAEEACLSPYHFHRIYVAMTGITIFETAKRYRLDRAASMLLHNDTAISRIASAAGYSGVQSFGRAFRKLYGIAPASYRKQGGISMGTDPKISLKVYERNMYTTQIETIPSMTLIALGHTGNYSELDYTFEQLMSWAIGQRLMGSDNRVFSMYYDDPSITSTARLRADACITVTKNTDINDPFRLLEMPETRCVMANITGPTHEVKHVFEWLYGSWLPENGEIPGEQPCFTEHFGDPRLTLPAEIRTRVCVPLQQI